MTSTPPSIHLDVAIIGGGIAGLWLLDRLRTRGVNAALFSQGALGAGQTITAQGMIHGGIKYTLDGTVNDASQSLANMPALWRECLAGTGEVDLTRTQVLSDDFYLWSTSALGSLTAFFASRAVRGRITPVTSEARPSLLDHPDFHGRVYRLAEQVIDVPSLLGNLADNNRAHIFEVDSTGLTCSNGCVQMHSNGLTISAERWVLSAGAGNAALLADLGCEKPAMQLRPLKQVMVRHRLPYALFGHCLGAGTSPRISFSSHTAADGGMVWYLGGALAEKGASLSDDQLINFAREELAAVFPWLDLGAAEFSTLTINRAEPRQKNGVRPTGAFAEVASGQEQVIVAWPTKLTLAPALASKILALLPSAEPQHPNVLDRLRQHFAHPAVAQLPWEVRS